MKDTLPNEKKQTIGKQNVEFYTDAFGPIAEKFVLYANPYGFGTEFCNVHFEASTSDNNSVLSMTKVKDECDQENRALNPSRAKLVCADDSRFACMGLNTKEGLYWAYMRFDVENQASAEALFKKMFFSFKFIESTSTKD